MSFPPNPSVHSKNRACRTSRLSQRSPYLRGGTTWYDLHDGDSQHSSCVWAAGLPRGVSPS